MKIYALIPAYNEEKMIGNVTRDVKKYVDEVVVVDDGSRDLTSSEAARGGVFVLRHVVNRGQGASIQTGLDFIKIHASTSMSDDFIVITFDADGQFEAGDIPRLIRPILNGEFDTVLGSRFLQPNASVPLHKKILLKIAILLTNITTGLCLTDTHNGLRALSGKAVQLITITQDRMAHGSEILSEIAKYKLRYEEISVTVKYTTYSLKKGQKFGDYFKILFDLFLRKLVQ